LLGDVKKEKVTLLHQDLENTRGPHERIAGETHSLTKGTAKVYRGSAVIVGCGYVGRWGAVMLAKS